MHTHLYTQRGGMRDRQTDRQTDSDRDRQKQRQTGTERSVHTNKGGVIQTRYTAVLNKIYIITNSRSQIIYIIASGCVIIDIFILF